MACFHDEPVIDEPVIIDVGGKTLWRNQVRRHYETGFAFALMPDCRCDLKMATGNSGHTVAESLFHGTRPRYGKVIEAMGVMEIVGGKITEIRDYHRPLVAKAA